jgi:hypothetical protein
MLLNAGSGFTSSIVYATAKADGKIIVVGSFTKYNTTTQVVRLLADGSLDPFTVGSGCKWL